MNSKIAQRLTLYFAMALVLFALTVGTLFSFMFARHTADVTKRDLCAHAASIAKTIAHFTKECDEGDLQWVDKEKLHCLNLWQGDRIFLRFPLAGEPFFSLKLVYDGDALRQAVKNGVSLPLPEAFQEPF